MDERLSNLYATEDLEAGVDVTAGNDVIAGNDVKVSGSVTMDEITTPTPVASKGKVYPKADNLLYFQDGAGVEHAVAINDGTYLDAEVRHAVFSDSTIQTITSTTVPWNLTFDSVQHEHGITLGKSDNCTISNATPAVISWVGHGLYVDSSVVFSTTDTLPTGITAGTTYYVITAGFGADSFQISATPQGAAVNTSSDGAGTHTATNSAIMTVGADGFYGFIFSTLCDCTSGNGTTIDIWFRKNGANLDRSNTRVQIATASNVIVSIADIALELDADDDIEMFWVGSSTNNRLLAVAGQASPTRPATPSTIITVKKISKEP